MPKRKILIQLDCDPHASVFDAVVATDAGVEQLLQYSAVEPADVRDLVHGAMFTRGPQDLSHTAIFVGGSNVATGEELLRQVTECFFGPLRVSVLLDANGANTTAAAAVLAAAKHVPLAGATAVVLAGTGPVGQRAARLLARQGASVRVASRSLDKARQVCAAINSRAGGEACVAAETKSATETTAVLAQAQIVIAAGAAGVELLPAVVRTAAGSLRVAIDLNAVPPVGISGIEPLDKGQERDGVICYGAIGVGGTKMKIHRAAIEKLFTANTLILDAEEVFAIGQELAK
ncbi:MAG: NADP-dependent methylenetetrahydromethanopterin/methylenetetrahydrofolate dehydrogenase [Pirellulaceae bacterium]|nr:NADP-dependent methylenetetrahydromethanopterin/methylenetetrahydrofolate dehydrogenase [Pirellulaceae bacterium]